MSPIFSDVHSGYGGRKRGGPGKLILFLVIVLITGGGAYFAFFKDKSPATDKNTDSVATVPSDDLILPDFAMATLDPSSTVEYSDSARNLFSDARAFNDAGQLLEARDTLYKLLEYPLPASVEADAVQLLGKINIAMMVSPMLTPDKEYYVIKSGDFLARIAQNHGTTVELIKNMNGLSSDMIRLGERLLVTKGTFTINASKSANTLDLLFNGRLFKRYTVGTGKQGRTPATTFTIVDKIVEPPWYRPDGKKIEFGDPENVLGTRWMKITSADHPELRGFGIHGTWQRDSIGKQSSAGCIRMLNEEVEELFDLVPRNTRVSITD